MIIIFSFLFTDILQCEHLCPILARISSLMNDGLSSSLRENSGARRLLFGSPNKHIAHFSLWSHFLFFLLLLLFFCLFYFLTFSCHNDVLKIKRNRASSHMTHIYNKSFYEFILDLHTYDYVYMRHLFCCIAWILIQLSPVNCIVQCSLLGQDIDIMQCPSCLFHFLPSFYYFHLYIPNVYV